MWNITFSSAFLNIEDNVIWTRGVCWLSEGSLAFPVRLFRPEAGSFVEIPLLSSSSKEREELALCMVYKEIFFWRSTLLCMQEKDYIIYRSNFQAWEEGKQWKNKDICRWINSFSFTVNFRILFFRCLISIFNKIITRWFCKSEKERYYVKENNQNLDHN